MIYQLCDQSNSANKFAALLPTPDMKDSRISLEIMVERSEETPVAKKLK